MSTSHTRNIRYPKHEILVKTGRVGKDHVSISPVFVFKIEHVAVVGVANRVALDAERPQLVPSPRIKVRDDVHCQRV